MNYINEIQNIALELCSFANSDFDLNNKIFAYPAYKLNYQNNIVRDEEKNRVGNFKSFLKDRSNDIQRLILAHCAEVLDINQKYFEIETERYEKINQIYLNIVTRRIPNKRGR